MNDSQQESEKAEKSRHFLIVALISHPYETVTTQIMCFNVRIHLLPTGWCKPFKTMVKFSKIWEMCVIFIFLWRTSKSFYRLTERTVLNNRKHFNDQKGSSVNSWMITFFTGVALISLNRFRKEAFSGRGPEWGELLKKFIVRKWTTLTARINLNANFNYNTSRCYGFHIIKMGKQCLHLHYRW